MKPETDKIKLLEQMRTEFSFVERTLALIPYNFVSEPGAVGAWSVKDCLAHWTTRQRRALDWLTAAQRGEGAAGEHPAQPETGFDWGSEDALNQRDHQREQTRPYDETLAEFHDTFERLYASAERMSDDELFGRVGVGALFREPVWRYFAENTYEHYEEHLSELRQWLRRIARFKTIEQKNG